MRRVLIVIAVLMLAVSACGGSDGADDPGSDNGSDTTTAGSDTTAPSQGGDTTTTAPASGGGIGGGGSATLTVGDQTYEFDNYYCIQGNDNTGNSRVSFSSGAMGEVDGVRVQLDASIQDRNENNAMDGDGTIQSVTLNDIQDFQNPSVSWDAVTGFVGEPGWVVEYDGSSVHAEALFDDGLTDDLEEIPGTLDATCG